MDLIHKIKEAFNVETSFMLYYKFRELYHYVRFSIELDPKFDKASLIIFECSSNTLIK